MKIYILTKTVQYEGSSLVGSFTSFDAAIECINGLTGYMMDGFTIDDNTRGSQLDDWYVKKVENCVGGIEIDGPADISFQIYTINL